MAQTAKFDIIEMLTPRAAALVADRPTARALLDGDSAKLDASVVSLVLSSISLLGAALAPAMMIRVLGWRRTGGSVIVAILAGFVTAALWKFLGFGAILNEAAPGILAGLGANFLAAATQRRLGTAIVE